MTFEIFVAINTVLCVVGFILAIIRNYYTSPPKKRGLWLNIYNLAYFKESPWLISGWWVSITFTYLLYKLEFMAAFAIINTLICFPAILIALIIVRKHRKKNVRSIPVFIIVWWVVITTLLIATGILTKLGLASEMLLVLAQIAAWLFIIALGFSLSVIGLMLLGLWAWDKADNISGKLYD
ncbi:MAG: hypothetical protein GF365_04835 [Candidatus Buchananbacteria bacterium]|nr:hypothetical protein [Candidatus Buchananbacteria bacterium]